MSRKLLKTLQSDEDCHAQSAKFLPLYDLIWQFQQHPQVKKASNETSKFTELKAEITLECIINQVCGIVHRPSHLVDILTPINHMVHINQKILCRIEHTM